MTGAARRVLALLAVLGVLCAAGGLIASRPARAAEPSPARVIVVGAAGLRWDQVNRDSTPNLWRLATHGSIGTLSDRAARSLTCPADGWLTLGAGNRARGPAHPPAGCPTGLPTVVQAAPTGPAAQVPAQPGIVADNRSLHFGTEPGVLGRTAGCTTAVGPGAALATADPSGQVARYAPRLPAEPAALLRSCPLTVIDAGDTGDAAALARVDALLGRVDHARPAGSLLLVVGVAETGASAHPRLHVAIANGPGFSGGWLRSASTRRTPYVQLIDVAPTVLAALGEHAPEAVVGQRFTREGGRPASTSAAVAHLADLDVAAGAMGRLVPPFFVILVLAQLLLYGLSWLVLRRLGHRGLPGAIRVRRWTGAVGLAAAAAVVSTYLANLLPWWRSAHELTTLLGCVVLFTAAITAVALAGPWRRSLLGPPGAVAGIGFGVLGGDILTGGHLQLDSLAGYSPLVAGRFAGFGNVAFAVFGTSALLFAAALVQYLPRGRSRRATLLTVAGVGVLAVALDGAPMWGSDFGGVLALVPAFAILAMLCAGIRVSLVRLLGVALAAVAAVSAIAYLDYLRPPEQRTHLGRFVGQVADGTAGEVIVRKGEANLHLLTHSVLTLLVPFAVLFLAGVLLHPRGGLRRAFELAPAFRSGLVSVLVLGVVGFLVNDSGVAVPALAMTVAIPLALAVAVRAIDAPAASGTSPRRDPLVIIGK